MTNFNQVLLNNIQWLCLISAILLVLLIVIMIFNIVKCKRIHRRYLEILNGETGKDLEKILIEQNMKMNAISNEHINLKQKLEMLDILQKNSLQKIAIHRFSAFSDVGGDLSYAIAMLDQNNSGMILSSIFSRQEHCTYVKPVVNGISSYALTSEETKVLNEAKAKN